MFAESDNHHLDKPKKIRRLLKTEVELDFRNCILWMKRVAYRVPIVQIRQIYPSVVVDEHRDFDLHVRSWLNESQWRIVRMSVHQPNANWKVVCIVCNSE